MKAVNLIPSEERRGGPAGPGRSGGAAYIVLGALGVLAVLRPQGQTRLDHGADPARAGSCQCADPLHELRRAARTAHAGGRGGRRLAL